VSLHDFQKAKWIVVVFLSKDFTSRWSQFEAKQFSSAKPSAV